ncbi:MAG: energy transducer TonB [Acidobacteriia bacterium]|nr:energy transducer TonB [Terriglobia bacterium]
MTVVFSLGVHLMTLMFLVLIPLIYTEALPVSQIRNYFLTAPPSAPPPPAMHAVRIIGVERHVTEVHPNQIQVPSEIPPIAARIFDEGPPVSPPAASPDGIPGVPGGSPQGAVPRWLPRMWPAPAPPPPAPRTEPLKPIRIPVSGGVQQAKLIYAPIPVYPLLAKQNHIQGAVVLEAIISKDGTIQDVQVESGHPFLVPAAIEAVKQWRYRPTLLNGQPVEVITTITVNFKLGGN